MALPNRRTSRVREEFNERQEVCGARRVAGFRGRRRQRTGSSAADFDWKKFQGKTVTFLANNNPVSQALLTYKADFEKLTGITLKVDGYQEQQMRQRLVTVMNAHSDEVDVFMTLPSREGEQFAASGWYADLSAHVEERGGKGLRLCRPEPGVAQGRDV